MFDTLIKNATVYSGLKEAPQKLQVAIQGDRIAAIARDIPSAQALQVIDAQGLYLCPGFIDPHASTGFGYFFPRAADHKLYQGITTEIFGNCGTSPAPIGEGLIPTMERLSSDIGFPFTWRSLSEYFDAISDKLQFNIGTLIGHSTLRGGYLSNPGARQAKELGRMKSALAEAMEQGALGLSTGLIYAPGCFAETEEIVALAKVAKVKGGIYASHIRDERDGVLEAVDEALNIAEKAEIPVLISHLKAAERQNWGKIPQILGKIEAYNQTHEFQAAIDVYPYTAVSTKLRAFIPKYLLDQGISALPQRLQHPQALRDINEWIQVKGYDLEQMLIISQEFEEYFGKNIRQISIEKKRSEAETIAELLSTSTELWIIYHCINETDMDAAISWDKAMVCTDSWSYPINAPSTIGKPHPRSYGAFTEYLERYVIQKKLLSWEEAINKVSYLPAQCFGLAERGQLKEGYFADLVLLDPSKVKANASYLDPMQYSSGVEHLWVNGKPIIVEGKIHEHQPGKVLTPRAHVS